MGHRVVGLKREEKKFWNFGFLGGFWIQGILGVSWGVKGTEGIFLDILHDLSTHWFPYFVHLTLDILQSFSVTSHAIAPFTNFFFHSFSSFLNIKYTFIHYLNCESFCWINKHDSNFVCFVSFLKNTRTGHLNEKIKSFSVRNIKSLFGDENNSLNVFWCTSKSLETIMRCFIITISVLSLINLVLSMKRSFHTMSGAPTELWAFHFTEKRRQHLESCQVIAESFPWRIKSSILKGDKKPRHKSPHNEYESCCCCLFYVLESFVLFMFHWWKTKVHLLFLLPMDTLSFHLLLKLKSQEKFGGTVQKNIITMPLLLVNLIKRDLEEVK